MPNHRYHWVTLNVRTMNVRVVRNCEIWNMVLLSTFGLLLTCFLFWISLIVWCVYDWKKLLYCLFVIAQTSQIDCFRPQPLCIKFCNESSQVILTFYLIFVQVRFFRIPNTGKYWQGYCVTRNSLKLIKLCIKALVNPSIEVCLDWQNYFLHLKTFDFKSDFLYNVDFHNFFCIFITVHFLIFMTSFSLHHTTHKLHVRTVYLF